MVWVAPASVYHLVPVDLSQVLFEGILASKLADHVGPRCLIEEQVR